MNTKQKYKDEEGFFQRLQVLERRDREYVLGLPWPLETVYHVADERMKRITDALYIGTYFFFENE